MVLKNECSKELQPSVFHTLPADISAQFNLHTKYFWPVPSAQIRQSKVLGQIYYVNFLGF